MVIGVVTDVEIDVVIGGVQVVGVLVVVEVVAVAVPEPLETDAVVVER